MDMKKDSKPRRRRRLLVSFGFFAAIAVTGWWFMLRMPGEKFTGEVRPAVESSGAPLMITQERAGENESTVPDVEVTQPVVLTIADQLENHVDHLSVTLGERNLKNYDALEESADYIEDKLTGMGYKIRRETFEVRGLDCHNIEAELTGSTHPDEIIIVGGHYDSVVGTPGANDNGSGTSAMLVLAELFKSKQPERTVRFVGWTNEEPPYFQTDEMGSVVYAKGCKERNEEIKAVFSLETMGYFSDEEDSQHYPAGLKAFYPSTGNFIGFVGNLGSRPMVHRAIKVFRKTTKFPSEGAVLPGLVPGVGWSDHWSFWQEGYQGIMITDTAPFRYPHYHKQTDVPEHIDFEKLAIVVEGLEKVVTEFLKADDQK